MIFGLKCTVILKIILSTKYCDASRQLFCLSSNINKSVSQLSCKQPEPLDCTDKIVEVYCSVSFVVLPAGACMSQVHTPTHQHLPTQRHYFMSTLLTELDRPPLQTSLVCIVYSLPF